MTKSFRLIGKIVWTGPNSGCRDAGALDVIARLWGRKIVWTTPQIKEGKTSCQEDQVVGELAEDRPGAREADAGEPLAAWEGQEPARGEEYLRPASVRPAEPKPPMSVVFPVFR